MKIPKIYIIDRYIIKKFLGTFFYAILLMIVIAVIFDFSEKIDDFLDKNAPASAIIFDYYLNFIPYFTILYSHLFTFIAVLFFTSKMAYNTEIVAILGSGISYKRLLYPYFISAAIITVMAFMLTNFVVPNANKKRLDFEEKYFRNNPVSYDFRNIHKQVRPGIFIYMESYSNISNTGYRFSIEKFEDGKLSSKLISEYIRWDSVKHKWSINNYYIRTIDGMKEKITEGRTIDSVLNIYPEDFRRRTNAVEAMNLFELRNFIKQQKLQGAENVELYQIEKYKRTALPFSTFILTLIGVSISSRKVRGGTGLHIGIGLGFCFSYIIFMQFSSQFSITGPLNPFIAVWLPNVIYAFIGYYLYKKAPK
jgi:lipopolysaccharide export system permease protein